MSISKGVELGSVSVPEAACRSRDSIREPGFIVIFLPVVFSAAMPGIPGIDWLDCDGAGMSMPSPQAWPKAGRDGTTKNTAFRRALTNSFRTNISIRLPGKTSFRLRGEAGTNGVGVILNAQAD